MKNLTIFFAFTLIATQGLLVAAPRTLAVSQPVVTRFPRNQSHDATQEVNQLAQTVSNIAVQCQNQAQCQSSSCSCPQGQCHCSQGSHCQVQLDSDDELDQVALSNFANMVQSFFNIVANPHNGHVVGTSIALMITSIINVAKKVMGKMTRMPNGMSIEEKEAYLSELESALRTEVRSLTRARKQLKLEEVA